GLDLHHGVGQDGAGGLGGHGDVARGDCDGLVDRRHLLVLAAEGEHRDRREGEADSCGLHLITSEYLALPSLATLPSRRMIWRLACSAMSGSCVTRMMVCPWLYSVSNNCMISTDVAESRFPVGSSASRID